MMKPVQFGSLYQVSWDKDLDHWQLISRSEKRLGGKEIKAVDLNLIKRQALWAVNDEYGNHATQYHQLQKKLDRARNLDRFDLSEPRPWHVPGMLLSIGCERLAAKWFQRKTTGQKHFSKGPDGQIQEQ